MAKVGQDLIQTRGLDRDTFCSGCGYNLRTRSIVGRCPECGGEYDARPVTMKGILLPQNLHLPLAAVVGAMVSAAIGFQLFKWAYRDDPIWGCVAAPFLVLCVLYLREAMVKTLKLLRYRRLMRCSYDQIDET